MIGTRSATAMPPCWMAPLGNSSFGPAAPLSRRCGPTGPIVGLLRELEQRFDPIGRDHFDVVVEKDDLLAARQAGAKVHFGGDVERALAVGGEADALVAECGQTGLGFGAEVV